MYLCTLTYKKGIYCLKKRFFQQNAFNSSKSDKIKPKHIQNIKIHRSGTDQGPITHQLRTDWSKWGVRAPKTGFYAA